MSNTTLSAGKTASAFNIRLVRLVFAALFAALIAVMCMISIQVGASPVPIVLQNMFAVLAGTILGPVEGAIAVAVFLAGGILGLPIFSGGAGGLAKLLGPTGGFLIGYFFSALISGAIMGRPKVSEKRTKRRIVRTALAAFAGLAASYFIGVPHLANFLANSKGISFAQAFPAALSSGVYPFIPGFIVKLILIIPITLKSRPLAARYINPEN